MTENIFDKYKTNAKELDIFMEIKVFNPDLWSTVETFAESVDGFIDGDSWEYKKELFYLCFQYLFIKQEKEQEARRNRRVQGVLSKNPSRVTQNSTKKALELAEVLGVYVSDKQALLQGLLRDFAENPDDYLWHKTERMTKMGISNWLPNFLRKQQIPHHMIKEFKEQIDTLKVK